MSYKISIDPRAHDDIDGLPPEALGALAEAIRWLRPTDAST